MFREPDVRANITLGGEAVTRGRKDTYRPAHLINGMLTTGLHHYLNETKSIEIGETVDGTITFCNPEAYPHSLEVGMRIQFQEGNKVAGYVVITEIYNELLKK